ncbi:MAG: glucokinase [Acidobacteriota bacterium]|nr:glucokinase [Acidobacteriota bacterium]
MAHGTPGTVMLVADVGGTNLNLALLAPEGQGFRILRKTRFRTQDERSLLEPIQRFLAEDPTLRPERACLSGAGPVHDRRIRLTHASWEIRGADLEASLGIPVKVVNDFTALTAGTLHLDLADLTRVTPLPHSDGALPLPDPRGVALVVGAGTGLGVGFGVPCPAGVHVLPSEGGHVSLPVFDEETFGLWRHLAGHPPTPPSAEMAVSGPGLARIFQFLLHSGRMPMTPRAEGILALPEPERPAAIAALAEAEPACLRALDLLIALYARTCADLCAAFLPTGGLFLAGGLVAKHAARLLEGPRFMAHFEHTHGPHLDPLLHSLPVFAVKDYDLSLTGAAHAWRMET